MKKYLEDYLWNEISYINDEKWNSQYHHFAYDVINEMIAKGWINSPKQAWRTLEKWTSKGIYNYGCRLDLGWKEKLKQDFLAVSQDVSV
jgi:hypothetical protein